MRMGIRIDMGLSLSSHNNKLLNNLPELKQVNAGTSEAATTNTLWNVAPTVGNKIFLIVTSSGTFSTPSGWTLDVNASSVKNLAYYSFYRTANGTAADTPSYTQSGNFTSVWNLLEFSGNLIFNQSVNNTSIAKSQITVTSPNLTPSSGNYLIITSLCASSADTTDNMDVDMVNITNSFTIAGHSGFLNGIGVGGSGLDNITQTIVYKVLTCDGVTSVNTSGDTWSSGGVPFDNPGSVMLAFSYS